MVSHFQHGSLRIGARGAVGAPLRAAILLGSKLGQYVGRITAAADSEASQLIDVTQLAGELDKLVHRVSTAFVGKSAQLAQVTPLARELDKLGDRISITVRGLCPQL